MPLPIEPPFVPIGAEAPSDVPTGPEWQYEPKLGGFRCLVFRDGSRVELQSESGRPFTEYFPELAKALRGLKPDKFVLDGEVVAQGDGRLTMVVYDMLVDDKGRSLVNRTLAERRARLEQFARECLTGDAVTLAPATPDLREARRWNDGIVAKRRDLPYLAKAS